MIRLMCLLLLFVLTSCGDLPRRTYINTDDFYVRGHYEKWEAGEKKDGKRHGLYGQGTNSFKRGNHEHSVIGYYKNDVKHGYFKEKNGGHTCSFLYENGKKVEGFSKMSSRTRSDMTINLPNEKDLKNTGCATHWGEKIIHNNKQPSFDKITVKGKISFTDPMQLWAAWDSRYKSKGVMFPYYKDGKPALDYPLFNHKNTPISLNVSSNMDQKTIIVNNNEKGKELYKVTYPIKRFKAKRTGKETFFYPSNYTSPPIYHNTSRKTFMDRKQRYNYQPQNDYPIVHLTPDQFETIKNEPLFEFTDKDKAHLDRLFKFQPGLISYELAPLFNFSYFFNELDHVLKNYQEIQISSNGQPLTKLKTLCPEKITSSENCDDKDELLNLSLADGNLKIKEKDKHFTLSLVPIDSKMWAGYKTKRGFKGVLNHDLYKSTYGTFVDMKPEGKGVLYDKNLVYDGPFKEGRLHGDVKIYNKFKTLKSVYIYVDGIYKAEKRKYIGKNFYQEYRFDQNWQKTKMRSYKNGKLSGKFKMKNYSIYSGKGLCYFWGMGTTHCEYKDGARIDKPYLAWAAHRAEQIRLQNEKWQAEQRAAEERERLRAEREEREWQRERRRERKRKQREREMMNMRFAMIDRQAARNQKRINAEYDRKIKRINNNLSSIDRRYNEKADRRGSSDQSHSKKYVEFKYKSPPKIKTNKVTAKKTYGGKITKSSCLKGEYNTWENGQCITNIPWGGANTATLKRGSKKKYVKNKSGNSTVSKEAWGGLKAIPSSLETQKQEANGKKAFAACWQVKNGSWLCHGPLQRLYAGEGSRDTALNRVSCPSNSLHKTAPGKGKASGKKVFIYNCNKALKNGDVDVFKDNLF